MRNILAVFLGIMIGSAVNMGLILLGHEIIPPPLGSNISDMVGLAAAMHLFSAEHFIFPFLAHAAGTFVGSLIVLTIATGCQRNLAWGIGIFFLLGGAYNVYSLPSPMWFNVVDLTLAYLPMSWLALRLHSKR